MQTDRNQIQFQVIECSTRWPIEQTGDKKFRVKIPLATEGVPVLNPEFVEVQRLTQAEFEIASFAAMKSIVVL